MHLCVDNFWRMSLLLRFLNVICRLSVRDVLSVQSINYIPKYIQASINTCKFPPNLPPLFSSAAYGIVKGEAKNKKKKKEKKTDLQPL